MNQARTNEHEQARHKRITGSRIAKIITGGPAAWDTLSAMLHAPEPEKFFDIENTPNMPEQMKRGHEYEPMARGEFFMRHDEYEVEQPDFCVPGDDVDEDLREWIGVSP
ncbi:MAG: YqaJ viral recombinase family protein, partial [Gammaproteobacteria bacterium]